MRKNGDKPVEEWSAEEQKVFHAADGSGGRYGKCGDFYQKQHLKKW